MTIHIKPISEFPYDVNRRQGTYFDRNGNKIDEKVMEHHYCVAYEGKDFAIAFWSRKKSKELTNIARFFHGNNPEEKRQIIWQKVQDKSLNKHFIRMMEKFRYQEIYLWYISKHDLATAKFIKRFIDWYHKHH